MAEISFGGLATGLPTEEIVEGLMAAERAPLERLQKEQEYEKSRLKAYEEFNDKLKALRTAAGDLNITSEVRLTDVRLSSDESISASSSGAQLGSYDITVAQLAQVQKDVSSGFSSDTEALLGTGTFTVAGEVIQVDKNNNSLQGLMESINALSEETGVSAAIINDGNSSDNYHLVFSGKDATTTFSVSHTLQNADTSSVSFSTSRVRDAQQSIAYVDGIEVVGNSNSLTGVVSGLTINLSEVSEIITPASDGNPPEYKATTLTVEPDTDSLKEKITTFVTAYNGIMEWIESAYNEDSFATESDTSDDSDSSSDSDNENAKETTLAFYLRGDASINGVKRELQTMLSSSIGSSGSLQILSEIGISTQVDGTLNVNSSKMDKALEDNFNDVVKLLAGDDDVDGVMKKFNTYLVETTSLADGLYSSKEDTYETKNKRLDNQILQKETLMEKIEARIRSQFYAMELLVSELNSVGDYLTQQLNRSNDS